MKPVQSLVVLIILCTQCQQTPQFELRKVLTDVPIVPKPVQVSNDSSYHLIGQLDLRTNVTTNDFESTWAELENKDRSSRILLEADDSFENEEYEIVISDEEIVVKGADKAGHYWGLATLNQVVALSADSTQWGWTIPTGTIRDKPAYKHRGMMLDISRHFFDKDEIKQIIDGITRYKINQLHLHLADDQGWRIEIKSWPKLTEIGGSTEVGGGRGGFLTQEDYKDLVAYAKARNMVVIPEIDMPGHTNAALASYAELNCDNIARELYTGIEVGFSTLCTDKDVTYQFVDDVVREISAISPGPYFHIGGDESHVTAKEDYMYFIHRSYDIVKSHQKKMIGWDEVGETHIGDSAVIQLWRHEEKAIKGMEKGAQVIFSLGSKTYLDMKYDSTTELGLSWAGYIPLTTAYNWDPTDFIDEKYQNQFLGLEAPLWSETVTNVDEAEYMIFPRITAYAEIGWTNKNERQWNEYLDRIKQHQDWWTKLGIEARAIE